RAAIPLIDAAQAINQNMTTMATRLARAPADEAERQAQAARLPDLRGELQGISRAARRFDGEAAALLRDALGEQREVLDVYRATLNEPASPPPSSLKRRLREI